MRHDLREQLFNHLAMTYDEHMESSGHVLAEEALLRGALRHVTPPRSVLDVGCGSGRSLQIITDLFSPMRLVGVDVSHSMLALARSRFAKDQRVVLIHGSAEATCRTAIDGRFDLVIFAYSICWIDLSRLVPQLLECLNNGAFVVVIDDVYLPQPLFAARLPRHFADAISTLRTARSKAEVEELFANSGFSYVCSEVVEVLTTHQSYSAVFRFSSPTARFQAERAC